MSGRRVYRIVAFLSVLAGLIVALTQIYDWVAAKRSSGVAEETAPVVLPAPTGENPLERRLVALLDGCPLAGVQLLDINVTMTEPAATSHGAWGAYATGSLSLPGGAVIDKVANGRGPDSDTAKGKATSELMDMLAQDARSRLDC